MLVVKSAMLSLMENGVMCGLHHDKSKVNELKENDDSLALEYYTNTKNDKIMAFHLCMRLLILKEELV